MPPRDDTDMISSTSAVDRVSPQDSSLTTTDVAKRDFEIAAAADRSNKPSNEQVLNVAFFSFVGFMAVQAIFALIAHSQSMLADSEAMSVDAITYLFNLCAERIKNRPPTESELRLTPAVREYRREMRRLYVEIIPPSMSVMALVIITIFTLIDACGTLFREGDGEEDDVSVGIMLFFSTLNMLLDVVNVTCFARADMNFGLNVVKQEQNLINQSMRGIDMDLVNIESAKSKEKEEKEKLLAGRSAATTVNVSYGSSDDMLEDEVDNDEPKNEVLVNLNMCSAWTHVCADTLRSAAVLVAAGIATAFPSVDGSSADALAAVVVSVIILVSLIPLVQGLVLTGIRIRELRSKRPE